MWAFEYVQSSWPDFITACWTTIGRLRALCRLRRRRERIGNRRAHRGTKMRGAREQGWWWAMGINNGHCGAGARRGWSIVCLMDAECKDMCTAFNEAGATNTFPMDWCHFHFLVHSILLWNSFFVTVPFHYATKAGICIIMLTVFMDRGILHFFRDVMINFFYAFGDGLRIKWQGAIRQENWVQRDIARQTVYGDEEGDDLPRPASVPSLGNVIRRWCPFCQYFPEVPGCRSCERNSVAGWINCLDRVRARGLFHSIELHIQE